MKSKIINERQRELRKRLWPDVTDDKLWTRQKSKGFATIPRTLPLMMSIMDQMSKTKPVSTAYLELFCRGFDDCMIILNKHREMAFHAGFDGQRGERTWRERIKILEELGFIKIKEGPSGPISYALILNPYHVIKSKYKKHLGITPESYHALLARVAEIGATDMDDPPADKPRSKNKESK